MKSVDYSIAYQIQKKYTHRQHITAYKVGASNFRSGDFFGCDEVLLGGIPANCVFEHEVTRDYKIAELEIMIRVRLTIGARLRFEILDHCIGFECPEIMVENPDGDPFVCIAENCAAGDLLIYDSVDPSDLGSVRVFKNGKIFQLGLMANLRYDLKSIVEMTVATIDRHRLPCASEELWIATGGITGVFPIERGDRFEFDFE